MSRALYIGLISGTSMDGIDCALVDLGSGLSVLDYLCHPLDATLRTTLLWLCGNQGLDLVTLGNADIAVAQSFAAAVNALLARQHLSPDAIIAIGSHGQTLWHEPPKRAREHAFTLQIGDPSTIAALTGITTVADFRRKDLAYGGQGAPIVPALHRELFSASGTITIVLNLGGIANITVLPPPGGQPFGFDTGPANVLMDGWIAHQRGLPYDESGHWAQSGTVQPRLLRQLLREPYLSQSAPKSTGRELFNLNWLQGHLAAYGETIAAADVQATLLDYTAVTVRDAVLRYAQQGRLIVCGGGARNSALLARLAQHLHGFTLSTSTDHGLHADAVEAAAFAWFASKTLQRTAIDFSPFTGAKRPVIAGGVYFKEASA
ncbi:MAG: anhydro-N-acetylmuramic acid kinase [Pseudomonadales bacterium]|jgi:anhydro-N-acetylmuramic acid kinase|nr:anhydro-N-acetylmuramic acid kinase [Pseudomonadales bacterium]